MFSRSLANRKRPSAQHNKQILDKAGISAGSIAIREALSGDVPALAALHVKTWAETYPGVKNIPTFELREKQWSNMFLANDRKWFCLVAENQRHELVGFAKGQEYGHYDLPVFSGELNKIYLLRDYQRLGIGRRLVCEVAKTFIKKGITSMVLFGDAQNPSGYFYEAMGAEKLYADNGEFHGGYGWKDLTKLTAICKST